MDKQVRALSLSFLGDEFDYCRDNDETSDNEHYPVCGKGLIYNTYGNTWGYCKNGEFYAI